MRWNGMFWWIWLSAMPVAAQHSGHTMQNGGGNTQPGSDALPPGYAMVKLTGVQRQLSGVVSVPVARRTLVQTLDLSGVVDAAEPQTFTWSPRFSGWITRLYLRETGQHIRAGEPWMEVYSPVLIQAQEEFVYALEQGDSTLIRNAREKLRLLEVAEPEILALERDRKVRQTLVMRSPYTGVVTEKHVVEGSPLRPGMKVFTVVSLDRVWIRAAAPEQVAADLRVGDRVQIQVGGISTALQGVVRFVSPVADPRTRTVELRVELANPQGTLRPGMVATVRLRRIWPDVLVIPGEAVIQTGRRNVVFVEVEEGHYMPREVELGRYGDDGVEIRRGLKEGERVVARGTFLLDAESRIRGGGGGGGHHH